MDSHKKKLQRLVKLQKQANTDFLHVELSLYFPFSFPVPPHEGQVIIPDCSQLEQGFSPQIMPGVFPFPLQLEHSIFPLPRHLEQSGEPQQEKSNMLRKIAAHNDILSAME